MRRPTCFGWLIALSLQQKRVGDAQQEAQILIAQLPKNRNKFIICAWSNLMIHIAITPSFTTPHKMLPAGSY